MSHNYLFDLHEMVEKKLSEANRRLLAGGSIDTDFEKGRIQALSEFRTMLSETFYLKLPKRLRGKYAEHQIETPQSKN